MIRGRKLLPSNFYVIIKEEGNFVWSKKKNKGIKVNVFIIFFIFFTFYTRLLYREYKQSQTRKSLVNWGMILTFVPRSSLSDMHEASSSNAYLTDPLTGTTPPSSPLLWRFFFFRRLFLISKQQIMIRMNKNKEEPIPKLVTRVFLPNLWKKLEDDASMTILNVLDSDNFPSNTLTSKLISSSKLSSISPLFIK